jgi:HEPN domain-containing protein
MADDLQEATRAWLIKALSDLRTSMILAADPEPPMDTAIYHCQQAAEKALKAFLFFHGEPLQKTHDVDRLRIAAAKIQPGADAYALDAALLAPLATSFRYPDESDWLAPLFPTDGELQEALAAARRIYDFVISVLPPETHPR